MRMKKPATVIGVALYFAIGAPNSAGSSLHLWLQVRVSVGLPIFSSLYFFWVYSLYFDFWFVLVLILGFYGIFLVLGCGFWGFLWYVLVQKVMRWLLLLQVFAGFFFFFFLCSNFVVCPFFGIDLITQILEFWWIIFLVPIRTTTSKDWLLFIGLSGYGYLMRADFCWNLWLPGLLVDIERLELYRVIGYFIDLSESLWYHVEFSGSIRQRELWIFCIDIDLFFLFVIFSTVYAGAIYSLLFYFTVGIPTLQF